MCIRDSPPSDPVRHRYLRPAKQHRRPGAFCSGRGMCGRLSGHRYLYFCAERRPAGGAGEPGHPAEGLLPASGTILFLLRPNSGGLSPGSTHQRRPPPVRNPGLEPGGYPPVSYTHLVGIIAQVLKRHGLEP